MSTLASAPPPPLETARAPAGPPPPSRMAPPASSGPATERAVIEMSPAPVFEPPRIVLNAVEGWGKTTIGAYSSPKPLMVLCGNETGYNTLLGARTVPAVPRVHATSLPMLLDALGQAVSMGFGSIVLDATGGLERLAWEHVCNRDFKGDWGETGFLSYQKGPKIAITEILKVLSLLDEIRAKSKSTVWLLGHVKTAKIDNPMGPSYDQFTGDLTPDTQAVIFKWADAVFLGKYKTIVDTKDSGKKKGHGKGIGGTERVMYVDGADAVKAKNRYLMDTNPLTIPDEPSQSAGTIWASLIKNANQAPPVAPTA